MDIAAIAGVGAVDSPLQKPAATGTAAAPDFARWLDDQLQVADRDIKAADKEVQKLALGETDNLHNVMLSLERARTSLELVVQVRNRLLEAYQDIQRMQV